MIDIEIVKQWLFAQLKSRDIVIQLIAINCVAFLLSSLLQLLAYLLGYTNFFNLFIQTWLAVPSQLSVFVYKVYSVFTYQFLHSNILHLLSNMLILFYFGSSYIRLTHKKKLLPLYIFGGVFSALFYLLVYNLNPILSKQNITLLGASGSVMAILAAVATRIPNSEILLFGRLRIKYQWIVVFFVLINLIGLSGSKAASSYAHLGGLLFGYIFEIAYRNGFDFAKYFNLVFDRVLAFFSFAKKPQVSFVNKQFKSKKHFNTTNNSATSKKATEKKMNAILDKIKHSGYEKLTKAEKDFLFKNSNK